jgi:HD-like signal output (HDOD) protein
MEDAGTEYWTKKLTNSEMPILSNVVFLLNELMDDDTAGFKQLAEVILKDPHLTTHILKLVNSPQYNLTGRRINTVSRAIVILGFRKVHSFCMSLMAVDSLVSKQRRERLLATMNKAFFAAVHAKEIYKQISHNPAEQENVFIAGLLLNIGEMVFWAHGGKSTDSLDDNVIENMLNNSNYFIEKELGTSFRSLSKALSKTWDLSELLQISLSSKSVDTKKSLGMQVQAVIFGDLLSKLKNGQEAQRRALVMRIAKFIKREMIDATQLVNASSEMSAKTALDFCSRETSRLRPKMLVHTMIKNDVKKAVSTFDKTSIALKKSTIPKPAMKPAQVLLPDLGLQSKILHDLANDRAKSMNMNTILRVVLTGMHVGIGLERIVMAVFNKDQIQAKYVLGEGTEDWQDRFLFSVGIHEDNIFSETIKKPQPVWIDSTYIKAHRHQCNEKITAVVGGHEALVGVLKLNNRNIVMFYADRSSTGESLTQAQFESFSRFLIQAESSVLSIADKRSS